MPTQGNQPVKIRADEATKARWQAAAKRDGKSLAAWLRDAADAAATPVSMTGVVPPKPDDAAQSVLSPKENRKRAKPPKAKPDGPVDLKSTTQELCPHRIPISAYCARCEG